MPRFPPFEFDLRVRLTRRRSRSQESIAQYPFGEKAPVENPQLRPITPVASPTNISSARNSFTGLGKECLFVPSELPDNTASIPRQQYQDTPVVSGHPSSNNGRPSSWGPIPREQPLEASLRGQLPHLIINPPTMVGNLHPGHNPHIQSPLSPPASPIASTELGLLRWFQTVFIVDDSTSMISSGHLNSIYGLLETLVPLATQHGERDIEIQFLSDDRQYHSQVIKRGDKLPPGENFWHGLTARSGASMSAALKRIIKPYLRGLRKSTVLRKEGLNIIVITDGRREDRTQVEKYIVDVARKLTEKGAPQHLVGIQFVQVGNDESAKAFFQSVDDSLEGKYKIRDIVDTTIHTSPNIPLTKDGIEKILLGGISQAKDKMVML